MAQSYRDLDPDLTSHTTAVRVVLEELVLVEVLGCGGDISTILIDSL